MAKDKKNITLSRTIFISVFLLGAAILICWKSLSTKLIFGAKANHEIETLFRIEEPILARRGDILAHDGRILACSVPNYKIAMDPCTASKELFDENIDALCIKLANLFGDLSPRQYKDKIVSARTKNKRFIYINSHKITYTQLKEVKQFPIFDKGRNVGGFIVEEFDMRKMPFGLLAARTIGDLHKDNKDNLKGGHVGIEHAYETVLRGVDGLSNRTKLTGSWIDEVVLEPVNGQSVITTLDIDIQDVAENSLLKQLIKYEANYGVAILMEVKTGAIRAIVNLQRTSDGRYVEGYNYAIGHLVEPGSTFKLASIMALLEDDLIDVNDTVDTGNGRYKFFDNAVMTDSKEGGHGKITIREAFEVSSNIGISRIVQDNYGRSPQNFVDRLRKLGICDSLMIDLAGARKTYLKNHDDATWSGTTLPWMSIGYEVKITPLELLTFYNAVANNGTMMKPMFVEGLMEHGNVVDIKRPKVLRTSIASKKTIKIVQELLKGVVEHGTAKNISNTPYKIAGKTGTAQIAEDGGGYTHNGEKKHLASFAGYFPADEPLYSCIVMVSGPKNVYYGNQVAGSVVKDIADRVYATEYRNGNIIAEPIIAQSDKMPYSKGGKFSDLSDVLKPIKIPFSNDGTSWLSATAKEDEIKMTTRRFVEGITPDVKGMGASDAVSLLESLGFQVQLRGFGRVTNQSIVPGTPVYKGIKILIELSNG